MIRRGATAGLFGDSIAWLSMAGVDFVIQREGKVIPIEVKYDTNVHARSLKHYCRLYAPELAVRISGRNFGYEDGIMSVPLYGTYCI